MVYPVNAVGVWGDPIRQRKPTLCNDYEGLISPTKHGHPEGHVKVRRYMGVPVWDGRKIVMLVGLGNKKEPYTLEDARHVQEYMAQVWSMVRVMA